MTTVSAALSNYQHSIVNLLDSQSQLDITSSIISPIRRFSLEVVVVEHMIAYTFLKAEVNSVV